DRGDVRVREHRSGDVPVIGRAQLRWAVAGRALGDEVVADDAGLVVRHVLELVLGGNVAERVNAGCAGALVRVDPHAPVVGELDAAGGRADEVGVRGSADRYEKRIPGQGRAVGEVELDARAVRRPARRGDR